MLRAFRSGVIILKACLLDLIETVAVVFSIWLVKCHTAALVLGIKNRILVEVMTVMTFERKGDELPVLREPLPLPNR